MKKILFACDLDNTLFVSNKRKKDEDICVEINKGVKQSFMTPKAIHLLKEIEEKLIFVPVTTRSTEQYERIDWPFDLKPKYAVVANGAILLNDKLSDDIWLKETKEIIDPWRAELQKQLKIRSESGKYIKTRIVDESFLFLYCGEGADVEGIKNELSLQTNLKVEATGRKIYLFPPKLSKGAALLRLKERLNANFVYAAGDSFIDVPMLENADEAFAACGLRGKVKGNFRFQPEGVAFSEWFLEELAMR
ncbi:MAG: HAD hydrolase family protein [Selenomonadaceae bacterium]|nr:HAD hydrolase family protein [Selenomonadaceae bacterium]